MSQSNVTLGNGQRFVMKRTDNIKPDKCLTALGNTSIGSSNCSNDRANPTQIWYLASDGTLRHNHPFFTNKCVRMNNDFSLSMAPCQSNSTKFTYDVTNNRLRINGTNPPRCINLAGRNYSNLATVDAFVCTQAAPDTITWISEPVTTGASTTAASSNIDAAVTRSQPAGLQGVLQTIDKAQSTIEKRRNQLFGQNVANPQQEIADLQSSIGDSLLNGDLLFGDLPHSQLIKQVMERNKELKDKKEKLSNNIKEKEALIDRSNREFVEEKKMVPEPQEKKLLRFVEDYSLGVLLLSYMFLVFAFMYWYIIQSPFKVYGFLQSFLISAMMSAFLFMVLVYVS
jgi:hypothetical protein